MIDLCILCMLDVPLCTGWGSVAVAAASDIITFEQCIRGRITPCRLTAVRIPRHVCVCCSTVPGCCIRPGTGIDNARAGHGQSTSLPGVGCTRARGMRIVRAHFIEVVDCMCIVRSQDRTAAPSVSWAAPVVRTFINQDDCVMGSGHLRYRGRIWVRAVDAQDGRRSRSPPRKNPASRLRRAWLMFIYGGSRLLREEKPRFLRGGFLCVDSARATA